MIAPYVRNEAICFKSRSASSRSETLPLEAETMLVGSKIQRTDFSAKMRKILASVFLVGLTDHNALT